jgi:uncharacterized radical SAM superfamily Fe-S cluster-containing enzyme
MKQDRFLSRILFVFATFLLLLALACLSVVELTDHCNLRCPVCYAGSGPDRPGHHTFEDVERRLDAVIRGEGEADVVQLSGGEPTLHPDFFRILASARARPIRHLMVNTNGLRLAQDPAFVDELATYCARHTGEGPGLEVYLQFDSVADEPSQVLRGARLSALRRTALERLDAAGISTTLVMTVARGVNDHLIGDVIRFGLGYRCVRGVTLQPVEVAGRTDGIDPARHRITLTEVRRKIAEQAGTLTEPGDGFRLEDIVPVPCNPDTLAMGYALKLGGRAIPVTRHFGPETLLDGPSSTIAFERDPNLKRHVMEVLSTGLSPDSAAQKLADVLCCLPRLDAPGLGYENVFRVLIVRFMDIDDLDIRALKRSCVHIAQPDGRLIPFESMNLFYRSPLATKADGVRAAISASIETRRRTPQ